MQTATIDQQPEIKKRRAGNPSFFPALYVAVVAVGLFLGGMTNAVIGDSDVGQTPPEAVAFVDADE